MTHEDLKRLVEEVRQQQCELDSVEIKSAHKGTPQRLFETLSSFANRTGGGILLFGLDENRNYDVVGVGNAQKLQEDISHLAAAEMEPVLRPEFTLAEIDGKTVLAVEVQEVIPTLRPCFYKPAGLQKGSYIRVANTNRQMTDYEVFGYVSARNQPTFDEEAITGATIAELDQEKINSFLEQLRKNRPQASYLEQPFENVLQHLRILRESDGILQPTLAGLLVFGKYPQTVEPQLVITFLHYYGTSETEKTPRGERFLDNRKFEGPVPAMIEQAVNHVTASIRKGSLIDGLYRRDIPEYPMEAVREALVNAVAHRDYSSFVRGSYIQIRLFSDRIEIQNPGGLYGNVTEETLEDEQSTRNRTLMRLMEDLHLVENRGSGIRAMIEAMRSANLEPPRFTDKRSSFWVVLRNLTLMSPEALTWLNQFSDKQLNDRQRLALVYLRHNHQITNFDYQRLTHVDSVTANRELRGLVQGGLINLHGSRRWAHYLLNVPTEESLLVPEITEKEKKVIQHIRQKGFIKRSECQRLLGVSQVQARYILKKMRDRGMLRLEGSRKDARYLLP